jgi:hypothetical protein
MSKFTETVKQDTPRLVVMFRREGDKELFNWGIVGSIPILTLVGHIVRTQGDLHLLTFEECPEPALCIAWDDEERVFHRFLHPSIPLDSLVGMLETIKQTILATHAARQFAAQQLILGPDGRSMKA